MSAERRTASARVDALQVLRFLAAVLVLIGHAQHDLVERLGGRAGLYGFVPFDWGLGVDIFFLISGFVMFYLMHDRFGSAGAAGDFMRRRLLRVVPLYWLFTTLVLAITLATGALALGPPNILFSYLFLPGPQCGEYCFPLFTLGWTLNYEMLFYVLFTIGLLFPRPIGLAFIFGAIGLLMIVGQLVPPGWTMLHFWGYPIIGEFLIGIGIAWAFRGGVRLPVALGWAMVAGGFALAVLSYQAHAYDTVSRLFTGGIPALLIVSGAVLALEPAGGGRWLAFLVAGGNASYALYLSHPLAIKAAGAVAGRLDLPTFAPGPFVACLVAAGILGAFVVHHLVEKPLLAFANRRWIHAGSTGLGDGQPLPGSGAVIPIDPAPGDGRYVK